VLASKDLVSLEFVLVFGLRIENNFKSLAADNRAYPLPEPRIPRNFFLWNASSFSSQPGRVHKAVPRFLLKPTANFISDRIRNKNR